ncbi:amidohydrolase family protein [Antiquaquibacter oligotrophicus]|uniref:amidohydrolase family protein n=1 Tax=Antiquaquibacter oligotrophicus TaxID=2880260 RepID=UPI002AC9A7B0|nr:amidohydrolase family protein [Antiquaquibacter oligotrophicus]UDF13233.1 amidohydrolase family protein [Antiquaquibacter oligotrophicus]
MSRSTFRARRVIVDAHSAPLDDATVVVEDGVITEVRSGIRGATDGPVIDVDGLLSPGFVDAHSHLRGISLEEHGAGARQFEAWILSLSAVTTLDPGDEAALACAELLATGVTAVQGFVDADPEGLGVEGARAALRGLEATGIRGLVVLGFADRALGAPEPPEGEWAAVPRTEPTITPDDTAALVAAWLSTPSAPTTDLGAGPIGAHWSTDALLEVFRDASPSMRSHTHLHESRHHRTWLTGERSPVDRLSAAGLLSERLSAAHGVHLTGSELSRLAATSVSLVHCPASNAALEVGSAHVAEWLEEGISVGLGVDSQNTGAPDYFDVMRAALTTSNSVARPLSAEQVFDMATVGGAACLGIPLGGRIAVGAPADLIELDLTRAGVADIVEQGTATAVRSSWVAGARVVDDGSPVFDASEARTRLRAALNDDRAEREARLVRLAPLLDRITSIAGGAA